jgi:hypothetical protein
MYRLPGCQYLVCRLLPLCREEVVSLLNCFNERLYELTRSANTASNVDGLNRFLRCRLAKVNYGSFFRRAYDDVVALDIVVGHTLTVRMSNGPEDLLHYQFYWCLGFEL